MRFNLEEVMLGMQAAVERELPEAMHKAAERVAAEARESHPYHDRSGTLTSQIKPGAVTVDGDTITAEVVADADYASHVEDGGLFGAPRPFLKPAFERRAREVGEAVTEHLARAASE